MPFSFAIGPLICYYIPETLRKRSIPCVIFLQVYIVKCMYMQKCIALLLKEMSFLVCIPDLLIRVLKVGNQEDL